MFKRLLFFRRITRLIKIRLNYVYSLQSGALFIQLCLFLKDVNSNNVEKRKIEAKKMSECFNGIISLSQSLEVQAKGMQKLSRETLLPYSSLAARYCEKTSSVLYLYWRSSDFDFSPRHGLVRSGSRVTAVKFLPSVHKHGEVGTITLCEKTQTITKYLHQPTSFYTETHKYLMITREVSCTWRFVKVIPD